MMSFTAGGPSSIQRPDGLSRCTVLDVAAAHAAPSVPAASYAQQALLRAKEDLRDSFEHFDRADNWHDLYKAYEAIKKAVGGVAGLKKLGFAKTEIDNFTMTAQRFRHHRTSAKPKRVLNFAEAKQLVSRILDAALSI